MPPSTIFHLGSIVAVLRRSPALVVHQDRHHAVVLTELIPGGFAGSEHRGRHRAVRVSRTRRRRSKGAWIGRIGRRTYTTSSALCQRFRSRFAWVRRQHSPLSLLCITMILRVRRNFFEITTFLNRAKRPACGGHVRRRSGRLARVSSARNFRGDHMFIGRGSLECPNEVLFSPTRS